MDVSEERAVRVVGRGESQSSFISLIFILNAVTVSAQRREQTQYLLQNM